MASVAIPDTGELTVHFSDPAGVIQCELTFAVNDPSGDIFANAGTFLADAWAAVTAHLVPASDDATTFNAVGLEDQRTVPYGGLIIAHTGTPGTGVTGGQQMATSACIAVERRSAGLGRSSRGRVYYPTWSTAWLSGLDQVDAAKLANLVTALGAFQTAVEGGTYPCGMGIVSKVTGGVPNVPPIFKQTVSWLNSDVFVDSQRRRLVGRGN